jgi:hypothetical protein
MKYATYSRHYKTDAQGHIFLKKEGACTINLVGAAAMSQEELDGYGELIAEAFNSKKATRADKVIDLICFDDEKDADIEACKLLLKLDNLEDKTQMLDHVLGDDEHPIEQFEYTFTVQDFLNHIA